ncbi:MAG TPA: hypothetical protein VGI43_12385 [Mucilaginibacter sp.]|jgi:hypothetical protein
MVSLNDRSAYIQELKQNPKFNLFYQFVNDLPISYDIDVSVSTDGIILRAIKSFLIDDKMEFESCFAEITGREPKSNSPFANDNILLYVMICGILKFGVNDSWIRKILKVRLANDEESHLIKNTFQNILDKNFVHSGNANDMIIPLESFINQSLLPSSDKKQYYLYLINCDFPPYKSDFLNVLALKSFDLLLFQNNLSENGAIFKYIQFEKSFLKRVDFLAKVIFALIILVVAIYIVKFVFDTSSTDTINKLVAISGLFGFGVFSFFKREWVLRGLRYTIKWVWGYKD